MKSFNEWINESLLESQNHFDQSLYTINGKNYKVSEIAKWADKNLRPVALSISDIQNKYIDAKSLFIDVEEGDWVNRSMNSNLLFPILVLERPDGMWEIIDGNHRIWKSWKSGMKTINAYLINPNSLRQI